MTKRTLFLCIGTVVAMIPAMAQPVIRAEN